MRACYLCGVTEELRPYGPNMQFVCFDCAMQNKEQTDAAFRAQLLACGPIVVIGEETGPRPLGKNDAI